MGTSSDLHPDHPRRKPAPHRQAAKLSIERDNDVPIDEAELRDEIGHATDRRRQADRERCRHRQ